MVNQGKVGFGLFASERAYPGELITGDISATASETLRLMQILEYKGELIYDETFDSRGYERFVFYGPALTVICSPGMRVSSSGATTCTSYAASSRWMLHRKEMNLASSITRRPGQIVWRSVSPLNYGSSFLLMLCRQAGERYEAHWCICM